MLIGFGLLFLTVSVSVFGYTLAGWDLISALYMVVITVFGVGFGEVHPVDTPELRIFTMFVIVAGSSSVVYIVGGFIQMLTEGEIQRALGERKRLADVGLLEKHVIICGFGRLGQPLSQMLIEARVPFVIVDESSSRIEEARERGFLAVQGDASEDRTLKIAGVERARLLATVLPNDAANVFITLTARTINPGIEIIARGEQPSSEPKLRAAGARHVVMPADIGAVRIANMITQPSAVEFLDKDKSRSALNAQLEQIDLRIDQFPLPNNSPLDGKRLDEVETLGKGTFLIVGVKQKDGTMVASPTKDFKLHCGDTMIVIGHRQDIPQFAAQYIAPRQLSFRGNTTILTG